MTSHRAITQSLSTALLAALGVLLAGGTTLAADSCSPTSTRGTCCGAASSGPCCCGPIAGPVDDLHDLARPASSCGCVADEPNAPAEPPTHQAPRTRPGPVASLGDFDVILSTRTLSAPRPPIALPATPSPHLPLYLRTSRLRF